MTICLVLASSLASSAIGQVPDPSGWGKPLNPISSAVGPVAKVSPQTDLDLATRDAPRPTPWKLTDEIRSQIGLASQQENVALDNQDPTKPHEPPANTHGFQLGDLLTSQSEQLTSPQGIQSSVKIALLLAILSLAPAIVLMTTCYIRVVVVLTLLKQAFGGQQLPPTQVLTALSLFLTFLVMMPVWDEVKTEAIDPYSRTESPISWDEAWQRGVQPIQRFMIRQIELADNGQSVEMFYTHLPDHPPVPTQLDDVPLKILLPAFMVSELKVAFLLGFQVFLPFLVLDLVVSSVTVSMGMLMVPPNMISFPLKLILFVMVDGWNLVIGMLLQSFGGS